MTDDYDFAEKMIKLQGNNNTLKIKLDYALGWIPFIEENEPYSLQ